MSLKSFGLGRGARKKIKAEATETTQGPRMGRRSFLKAVGLGASALGLGVLVPDVASASHLPVIYKGNMFEVPWNGFNSISPAYSQRDLGWARSISHSYPGYGGISIKTRAWSQGVAGYIPTQGWGGYMFTVGGAYDFPLSIIGQASIPWGMSRIQSVGSGGARNMVNLVVHDYTANRRVAYMNAYDHYHNGAEYRQTYLTPFVELTVRPGRTYMAYFELLSLAQATARGSNMVAEMEVNLDSIAFGA